ncbi:MAG: YdiU family protein [Cocleimonas sp.]|nr:YdiU family protein [Cocleimonas sp.]
MSIAKIQFNNSYVKLADVFYSKTNPTTVKNPALIKFNTALAKDLGLTGISTDGLDALDFFAGNKIAEGSEPLAMAYAGHQFGGFSPKLGDGRAILLGEIIAPDNLRYDFQLKGSGRTPWSRGGDGRSALGPVIREYLVSEAMVKLGVPTTRALAAVTTGEEIARNTLVPGGILTRIATGFVRVGTFQYFSSQGNQEAIKQLADYEIDRHYPEAKDATNPYVAFFEAVVDRQAKLIAQWMSFGFIHGVMNTDNMSIAGETIDYGPCAFMDNFSHSRVYSSIDHQSRYAYSNQPKIGQWNLVRLAETLLPLFVENSEHENTEATDDEAQAVVKIAEDILSAYSVSYHQYWLENMCKKLGLAEAYESDAALVGELLNLMENNDADFTLTFYYLSQEGQLPQARALFTKPEDFDMWAVKWQARLSQESINDAGHYALMQTVNPTYIPRNHQIEAAIRAAEDHNDFSVFHALHEVLENPFELQEGKEKYMLPPEKDEVVHQTFCGT